MLENLLNNDLFLKILDIALKIVGFLMPVPLGIFAYKFWTHYQKEAEGLKNSWILLEVNTPREMLKSPAAMELFYSNAVDAKLGVSFEIASINGKIRFFIRTPKNIRDVVETQIYAQYPQAKVVEVEDYVFDVPQVEKDSNWYMWGCEFKKKKEDFLPIRTYRNYGDDMRTGIEEDFKVDPITPIIEFMGSLSFGQQMWIQIITKQNAKKYYSEKKDKKVAFGDAVGEFLEKLHEPYTKIQKTEDGKKDIDIKTPKTLEPTIKAITEHMGQLHFDCGIRMIALSDKTQVQEADFDKIKQSAKFIFRQYSLAYSNELEVVNATEFESAWADPTGKTLLKTKRDFLNFYRTRMLFNPPFIYDIDYPAWLKFFINKEKRNVFVLSAEELASIYHFPGMVSSTPSLKRIETRISKPPANLPF